MAKTPPIPPEQRSPQAAGQRADVEDDAQPAKRGRNQGRQGNIKQNTHYQQDR